MSQAERDKWDARYAAGAYADREHPTRLLVDWAPKLTAGSALDVACGAGRNAIFLAQCGFATDAVDISQIALERARATADEKQLSINWIEADLDLGAAALPSRLYDVVLLVRYVDMDLYPLLINLLAPGGLLISEQHLATDEEVIGPKSPEFRLRAGALRDSTVLLEPLYFREGLVVDPDGRRAALAQIVARR